MNDQAACQIGLYYPFHNIYSLWNSSWTIGRTARPAPEYHHNQQQQQQFIQFMPFIIKKFTDIVLYLFPINRTKYYSVAIAKSQKKSPIISSHRNNIHIFNRVWGQKNTNIYRFIIILCITCLGDSTFDSNHLLSKYFNQQYGLKVKNIKHHNTRIVPSIFSPTHHSPGISTSLRNDSTILYSRAHWQQTLSVSPPTTTKMISSSIRKARTLSHFNMKRVLAFQSTTYNRLPSAFSSTFDSYSSRHTYSSFGGVFKSSSSPSSTLLPQPATIHSNTNPIRHIMYSSISSNQHDNSSIHDNHPEVNELQEEENNVDDIDYESDPILNGLNPAQLEAVTKPIHSLTRVIAGPGAGKTRVLTCRIAHLLKRDQEANDSESSPTSNNQQAKFNKRKKDSRILAVTFTKKSAAEMKERLETLVLNDYEQSRIDDVSVGTISSSTDQEEDILEEIVPDDEGRMKNHQVDQILKRVTFGTFHAVCAKILRWHGSELSSLPHVTKYQQRTVIQTEDDSDNVSTDDDDESTATVISTTSSAVLDGSFGIVDQSEQLRIIKQCSSELNIDLKDTSKNSSTRGSKSTEIRGITILNAVLQLKSESAFKSDALPSSSSSPNMPSSTQQFSRKVMEIANQVYPLYCKKVLNQNCLDFDDLLLLCRELLLSNPTICERMKKRWHHLLVDEFQDTSAVQLDIVKLLSTNSLMVVGDGDQSIYSWRGAYAEIMADLESQFESMDTVYLMENYRSTSNIIRAAQKIISNPSAQEFSSSNQDSIRQDMIPMLGKGPPPRVLACADAKAEASFVVKEINKMIAEGILKPSTSSVAIIYRTNAQSRALEEACIAHNPNLKYVIRGNTGSFYSRAEIKDCLCFLRWLNNGHDESAMNRAFKTPSRGIGDVSIKEFADYCSQVKMAHETTESAGKSPSPLEILISLSSDTDLYLSPDGILSKRTINRLLPFSKQMNKIWLKAQKETISDLLSTIISTLELRNHFDSISKTSAEFIDRWDNVNELRNAADRYSDDGPSLLNIQVETEDEDAEDIILMQESPLGNFLDDVSLLTETQNESDDSDSDQKRVVANLMTIHASKGMEYDAVFLVGNEEGTLPTQRALAEGEGSIELEEEKRLCYVAVTRAKTYLVMTWRKEVMQFFGQAFKTRDTDRSRFLDLLVAKKSTKKSVLKSKRANATTAQRYTSQSNQRMTRQGANERALPKQRNIHKKKAKRSQMAKNSNPRSSSFLSDNVRGYSTSSRNTRKNKKKGKTIKRSVSSSSRERLPRRVASTSEPPVFDSNMFYAVGTTVKHRVHGDGKVIEGNTSDQPMMISVRFDSGMELKLPLRDSGLIVKYQ